MRRIARRFTRLLTLVGCGFFPRTAQVEPGRAQTLCNGGIAAQRALHKATFQLVLEVVLRAKPAFKYMLLSALQIQHFHGVTRQVPSICSTALAQSDISPPGSKPRTSTSAPLIDSTVRTSMGADTVLAVMGSSKYMTLTTRR